MYSTVTLLKRVALGLSLLVFATPALGQSDSSQTARDQLSAVRDAAQQKTDNAKLLAATADEVTMPPGGGKSSSWTYVFADSTTRSNPVLVIKDGDNISAAEVSFSGIGFLNFAARDFTPGFISDGWIDSDEAVRRAEATGGQDFRGGAHAGNTQVSAQLVGLPENAVVGSRVSGAAWFVTYEAVVSGDYRVYVVDAQNGNAVEIEPTTEQEALANDDLEAKSANFSGDARLVEASTAVPDFSQDGRSLLWRFTYYSQSRGAYRSFYTAEGFGVVSEGVPAMDPPSQRALPMTSDLIDSDAAVDSAETRGDIFSDSDTTGTLAQAHLSRGILPSRPARPVWEIAYSSGDGFQSVYVDARNGDVLTPSDNDFQAAAVSFSSQTTGGIEITVDSVTVPNGGFVAIHDSTLLGGDALGSVIGVSGKLSPGMHADIDIYLFDPPGKVPGLDTSAVRLLKDQPLIAMPHRDTDGNGIYNFLSSNGQKDGPYRNARGKAIIDKASIEVETSQVTFLDQNFKGDTVDTVTVESVYMPDEGYVAIHNATLFGEDGKPFTDDDQAVGSVIGVSRYLKPGAYKNLKIPLFEVPGLDVPADTSLQKTQTLIAMPHMETNENQMYNFLTANGKADIPFFDKKGHPVVDLGSIAVKTAVGHQASAPAEFSLSGSYPNPTTGRAHFTYNLPEAAEVTVRVYNVMGRRIMVRDLGPQSAGADKTITLDAERFPAGVYVYRLTADGSKTHVGIGKLTVVR